jgi:hypothetical protein
MIIVVQLLLVVALATLVKLGTRRLFGGKALDQPAGDTKDEPSLGAAPRGKPKPTSRTNGSRRR